MKKISTVICFLVGVLVFAVEPCLAQAVKDEFSGYRVRTKQIQTDIRINACRYNVDNQEAWWTITVNNPLVDGTWYNWDTKLRAEIIEFTMPSGPNIPCDPSQDPPQGFKTVVMGHRIVFGPFTLRPDAAEGGVWEGTWKLQFFPDGDALHTAEAKGYGGLLEGKSLHVFTRIPAPWPTPMWFKGWVLTPASAQ